MKGYKATDERMQCRGYQFELGKWHEHEGDLVECQSGFHFCDHMPGVWHHYDAPGTRVFEVEAEGVLSEEFQCGTDVKRVCRRIRLVREMEIGGDMNSGDRNSGDRNSGNMNSGDRNSGNMNSGYMNSGYMNSGYMNSGYMNSGDMNSGDMNSGDRNAGDRNATDYSAGYFCAEEQPLSVFDAPARMSRGEFRQRFCDLAYELGCALIVDGDIDFERYKTLPNITPEKLKALHEKHLRLRKEKER